MGYRDIYGHLPPAWKVRRVQALILAEDEREVELYKQQQAELDELRNKQNTDNGEGQEGRRISVG